MRVPIDQLQASTLATIPELLRHPRINKYGIKRYMLDRWRKESPAKLTVYNVSNGQKMPLYKTTIKDVLVAFKTNLGVDVSEDCAFFGIDLDKEES